MAATDLHINSISKRFGDTHVLKDISLQITPGEFVSLLGPSGCGKSTLLRIIAGLEQQDRGTLTVGGRVLDHVAPKDRDLAFVFQSYALYPHLTARENIAAPLVMRELTSFQRLPFLGRYVKGSKEIYRSIDERVQHTSELLKLNPVLDRRPGELSGGQRQRVALGRALVRRPKIFLMDEPLANLDAGLRVHTRSEIARLHNEMGATTIFVTHDQAEATALSDRVAVMFGGEIRQVATPVELYNNPVDLDVARFITQPFLNVLPAAASVDGGITIGGHRVIIRDALNSPGPGTVAFRPEHATLTTDLRSGMLPTKLQRVEHAGTEAHVFVEDKTGAEFVVRVPSEKAMQMRPSNVLGLCIDVERAWFFPENGRRGTDQLKRAA